MHYGEKMKLYTVGAAWFEHHENEKGRIAPGNLADFALLSADYFTVPEDEIKNINAVLTIVDGRVVFGTRKYGSFAPKLPEPIPSLSPIKYFGSYYTVLFSNLRLIIEIANLFSIFNY